MKFTKVHGNGNDFILIEMIDDRSLLNPSTAECKWLCDRHYGVGADGIILISQGQSAPYKMTIWNQDGSRAEMCGNGLRCVALYLKRRSLIQSQISTIETDGGVYTVHFPTSAPSSYLDLKEVVSIQMGVPQALHSISVPHETSGDLTEHLDCLSWGNPHGVTFLSEHFQKREKYSQLWPSLFPSGINLSFAQLQSPTHIQLHVFERGCGWTLACGTGACATAYVAVDKGLCPEDTPLRIDLPGGPLELKVHQGHVWMTGGGKEVYEGILPRISS